MVILYSKRITLFGFAGESSFDKNLSLTSAFAIKIKSCCCITFIGLTCTYVLNIKTWLRVSFIGGTNLTLENIEN